MKFTRTRLAALMVVAMLSGGLAWAAKPVKPPTLSDPVNLRAAQKTTTSITLTWESGGGEAGFIVGYLEGALPVPKCENVNAVDVGNATSYTVTGLNPGTTYGFRACAYSSTATSDGATLSDKTLAFMYRITWIVGFTTTTAASINSDGHIVSTATSLDRYEGEEFAYIYTPGIGAQDLNELLPEGSGWYLWTAYDVNDYGQVVGEGYFTGVETRLAYRYTPASLTADGVAVIEAIGPLQGDDQRTSPRGINENGEVCGLTIDASGQYKTWFFSDDLKVDPGDSGMMVVIDEYSLARRINESGQILADNTSVTLAVRVVPFAAPEYFSGILDCWDMNDSGHFVGIGLFEVPINKNRTTIEYRAIRHDGTTMFDLGAGVAYGINNNGDVVGTRPRDPYNGYNESFVYLEDFQQLVNLDDAIDYCDEEELLLWLDETTEKKAWRINNAGQIAGRISNPYFPNPGPHAFILNPVPATP